jgi:hypothetical protein
MEEKVETEDESRLTQMKSLEMRVFEQKVT